MFDPIVRHIAEYLILKRKAEHAQQGAANAVQNNAPLALRASAEREAEELDQRAQKKLDLIEKILAVRAEHEDKKGGGNG